METNRNTSLFFCGGGVPLHITIHCIDIYIYILYINTYIYICIYTSYTSVEATLVRLVYRESKRKVESIWGSPKIKTSTQETWLPSFAPKNTDSLTGLYGGVVFFFGGAFKMMASVWFQFESQNKGWKTGLPIDLQVSPHQEKKIIKKSANTGAESY